MKVPTSLSDAIRMAPASLCFAANTFCEISRRRQSHITGLHLVERSQKGETQVVLVDGGGQPYVEHRFGAIGIRKLKETTRDPPLHRDARAGVAVMPPKVGSIDKLESPASFCTPLLT